MGLHVLIHTHTHTPGEKLLPDYFLDEAEDFQAEWLSSNQSPPSDTPESVFGHVKTLLNAEVVDGIKATFVFELDGNNPGVFDKCLCTND